MNSPVFFREMYSLTHSFRSTETPCTLLFAWCKVNFEHGLWFLWGAIQHVSNSPSYIKNKRDGKSTQWRDFILHQSRRRSRLMECAASFHSDYMIYSYPCEKWNRWFMDFLLTFSFWQINNDNLNYNFLQWHCFFKRMESFQSYKHLSRICRVKKYLMGNPWTLLLLCASPSQTSVWLKWMFQGEILRKMVCVCCKQSG